MRAKLVHDPDLHTHCPPSLATGQADCDCGMSIDQLDMPPLAFPTIYSLELTPSCNNRCPGCSNVFVEDKETRVMRLARKPLPFVSWKHIINDIRPYAQRLKVTGGESTQHPEFNNIIQYVQQCNIDFTLFTNARWRHPDRIIALLKDNLACIGLLISLHGADAKTHEAFTQAPGSFNETVANIQRAARAGLVVHTNTVFTRRNQHQITAIVQLSQDLGAQCAVFNRYIGQPIAEIELDPSELRRAVHEVDQLSRRGNATKFGTCVPLCFVESSSTGCLAGTAYCTIDPWGNVRPCNHAPQIAGNLLSLTLEQVWRSTTMETWRNLVPTACSTCSAFGRCHGGCRADMVLQGVKHDPLMSIPLQVVSKVFSTPNKEVYLYELAVPTLECVFQEEIFGLVLIKGSDVIRLSDGARPVLEMLKSAPTLQEIQHIHGYESIDLIGTLYHQGVVSLNW